MKVGSGTGDARRDLGAISIVSSCLKELGAKSCALLDYPDHRNAGDHLIWLGTLLALEHSGMSVKYSASLDNFETSRLAAIEGQSGRMPILLQGGGNLGDVWPDSQFFRERMVEQYQDRPIVVLSQSVHFENVSARERASSAFRRHPNLTLLVRDQQSYEIAGELFSGCKVVLAPDMSTFMHVLQPPYYSHQRHSSTLFLGREDKEVSQQRDMRRLFPLALDGTLISQDWCSYSWFYQGRDRDRDYNEWFWQIPGAVTVAREVWQRGLADPLLVLSRMNWNRGIYRRLASMVDRRDYLDFSWSLTHEALCQLKGYGLVLTDRLHGLLAARLMKIPGTLVSGSYHKNESYYRTWIEGEDDYKFVSL